MSNLLQNAVEFSPPGGCATIRLEKDDARSVISVLDEGTGVPAFAAGRIFERFFSLPKPQTGRKSSGLGLCFVREAAVLHGGSASLRNRSDRTGAVATLRLPRDIG